MKRFAIVIMSAVVVGCASPSIESPKPILAMEGVDATSGPVFYPVIAVKLKTGKAETLLPMKPFTSYNDCAIAAAQKSIAEAARPEVEDVLWSCIGADFREVQADHPDLPRAPRDDI